MTARKRRGGGGSPDKDVDGDGDMDKSKEQGGGGRGGARRRARRQCGSAGVPGAAASRAGGGAVRLALLSAACVASAALLWPALAPLLPLGLVGLGGAGDGGAPRCRAWIDTHRFKANETRLVAEALAAASCTPAHDLSRRHTKRSPEGSDWMARPGVSGADWEHRPRLTETQATNCLPGVYALTGKLALPAAVTRLATREERKLRELRERGGVDVDAAVLAKLEPPAMPQTFILPDDAAGWRRAMRADPAARWVLKSKAHLGKDLRIVAGDDALVAQLLGGGDGGATKKEGAPGGKYRLAQRYVHPPLLLGNGHKFGLRLWVVLRSTWPALQASLYRGGLVLFAEERYSAGGDAAAGGLTNAALNREAEVWSVPALGEHWARSDLQARLPWETMWARIQRCLERALVAGEPDLHADAARAYDEAGGHASSRSFQILGADILIDAQLTPWLLEMNGTPSLKSEPGSVAEQAKRQMLADLFKLVGIDERERPYSLGFEELQVG